MKAVNQPHEVHYLDGSPINWHKPPKATQIVSWSKLDAYGRKVQGSFRTMCHLNRLNNLALKKYGVQITIIQPDWNTGVPASAGTHNFDSCWDLWIPGVGPWEQQRFFRANGFACWYRHPPLFGNHIHGFTLPHRSGKIVTDDFKTLGVKVGLYIDGGVTTEGHVVASSQIDDYYKHAFGLAGMHTPGSDRSWFPKDIADTAFDLKPYVDRRAA